MVCLVKYTSGGLKGRTMVINHSAALKLEKHGLIKILKIYDHEPTMVKK